MRSPKLTYSGGFLWTANNRGFLCRSNLLLFVEIPEAVAYWIEVRRTQWPDDSGVALRLRPSGCGPWFVYLEPDGLWHEFLIPVDDWIEVKLKLPLEPITVYFRLLYEE